MSCPVVVVGHTGAALAVDSSAYTLTPTPTGHAVTPDPAGAQRKAVRAADRVAATAGVSSFAGVNFIDIVAHVIARTPVLDDIPDALLTAAAPILVPAYTAWRASPAGAASPDSAFLELIVLSADHDRPEALTIHTSTTNGALTLVGDVYWARNNHAAVEAIGAHSSDLHARTQRGRLTATAAGGAPTRHAPLPDPGNSAACAAAATAFLQPVIDHPPTAPQGWPAGYPLVTGPVVTLAL